MSTYISPFLSTFQVILPEIFIAVSLSFLLVFGSLLSTNKKNRFPLLRFSSSYLSILIIGLALLLLVNNSVSFCTCFSNSLVFNSLTTWIKFFLILFSISCIFVSLFYIKNHDIHAFEYNIFILFAILGLMLLVSSNDFVFLYLAIELQSLSFYTLASFKRGSAFSTEAGLKYFILGAFSSGLLLFGSSLIYGLLGTTNFEDISRILILQGIDSFVYNGIVIGLVFLLFGLLFKIAAVPFHVWAPDVYEGSPTSVATFFAVVPKMVLLTVLLRVLFVPFYDLLDVWSFVIILSSLLSMVFSSIVALYQKRLKRFLAYSSIGHVGYLLVGVSCVSLEGIQAVFFYIIIYSIMSINLWTILLSLEQKKIGLNLFISQLGGLSQTNLFLSLTIAVSMFSALGLPPIAGFFAKMQIFLAAMASSLYLLGIIGVLSSVIGAFYYLRFVKILFFDPPTNVSRYVRIDYPKAIIISLTFFIILFIFIHPTPLLILTHCLSLELIF